MSTPSASSIASAAVCDLFKAQVESHEELRTKHLRLQRQHEAALRLAKEHERALGERMMDVQRSSELVASLRESLSQYVAASTLHSAFADGNLASSEREEAVRQAEAARARESKLKQELEERSADLDAMRTLAPDLAQCRVRIADLEGECERAQAAARRSEQSAKEQEAKVTEYHKRCAAMREAMGRSEMDHLRAKDEMQLHLKQLADKLRHEKSLTKQLSARIHELQGASTSVAEELQRRGAFGAPHPSTGAGGGVVGGGAGSGGGSLIAGRGGASMFRAQQHPAGGGFTVFQARQSQQRQLPAEMAFPAGCGHVTPSGSAQPFF